MASDEEIRALYGRHAIISRKRGFALVHLDSPSPAELRRRTEEFEPDEFFDDDCPLCAMMRAGGVLVYHPFDEAGSDEILLE